MKKLVQDFTKQDICPSQKKPTDSTECKYLLTLILFTVDCRHSLASPSWTTPYCEQLESRCGKWTNFISYETEDFTNKQFIDQKMFPRILVQEILWKIQQKFTFEKFYGHMISNTQNV